MFVTFVVAAAAVLPVEFVVDCSNPPPAVRGAKFAFSFRYECWDGSAVKDEGVGDAGASGSQLADVLTDPAERRGWSVERLGKPGDEEVFVIRGSKTRRSRA